MAPTDSRLGRPVTSSGIPGLDSILDGGFTRGQLFLLEGVPGSGKTTLAMQFLLSAKERGESVVYVSLSESAAELQATAVSHGWNMDRVHIIELAPAEALLDPDEENTMFHPAEIELAATTRAVLADVERLKPTSLVFDSLSELRLLAGSALRYRRQILGLKQYFAARNCTVLMLDDLTGHDRDLQVQSIAHGVILLEQTNPDYGSERRRLRVVKYRGVQFRGGYHDYLIRRGGLEVFPRLIAAEHRESNIGHRFASDIAELDVLIGGGLEAGTSTLIVGAAGTGKSTIAAQFAAAAAARGERAALWVFDEHPSTLISRCKSLSVNLQQGIESGRVTLQQVDPAELTPGEFIAGIRKAVEHDGANIVVIDSLNGFMNAMPEERFLTIQLHELLMYLGQKSVATLLIGAHQGLIGTQMATPIDASYLADAVILLRYFEAHGAVHQAISVVKKRGSKHERTIREIKLDTGGIRIGDVLREFRGVLTGVPVYGGGSDQLIDPKRL
jgi:circadian clock protein KaiC